MNESPVKPSPLLRAEGLTKTYPDGEVQALRGVSLNVEQNEAVAIMGPSGCGKSTLLNLLGGLDRPTEGEIYFRGTPLSRIDRDQYRAREIGFIFQSFYVLSTLSAVENVQVPMFETTLDRRQRIEARGGPDRTGRPGPSPEPPSDAALGRRAPASRYRPRPGQ